MSRGTSYQVATAGIKVGKASTDLAFVLGQAIELADKGYSTFIRQVGEFERNSVRIRSTGKVLSVEASDGFSAGTLAGAVQQIIENLNGRNSA